MIAEAIIFDHFFDASASVGGAAAGAKVGRLHTRGAGVTINGTEGEVEPTQ